MDLGELVVSLRLRTDALEKGLDQTQKKMQEAEREAKKKAATMRELETSYKSVAGTAAVAFGIIVAAVKSGVSAYNEYKNAMVGLKSVAEGTGNSFGDLQRSIDELTSDGLIPASSAATSLKNLLARGFSADEAVQMLSRLKDAASFGRQASLSMGDAVRSATEGIKNENSILVDNAGVTKNVSAMWKDYAQQIGKGADSLTIAEKRQAEFNGIMYETRFQVGDAAKYAAEFSGQQAKLGAETLKLSQAFGQSQIPTLQALLSLFNPIITWLTSWMQRNNEFVGTVTAMAAALTGLIAVIAAVSAAMMVLKAASNALKISLGGIVFSPWVIGLTALAGILSVVASQKARVAEETRKLAETEKEYNRIVREGIQQNEVESIKERVEELKKLKQQYDAAKQAVDDYHAALGGRGGASRDLEGAKTSAGLQKDLYDAEQAFKDLGYSADEAARMIAGYEAAIKKAQVGTIEIINEQAKQAATTNAEVMALENLIKQYKNAEKGSADWNSAQADLAKQFPQFSTALGINIEAIEGVTRAKRNEVDVTWQAVQAKAQELLVTKQNTLAQYENELAVMNVGRIYSERIKQIYDLRNEIDALNGVMNGTPGNVQGIAPVPSSPPQTTSTYENKALEAATRQMEHLKRLDQLTLQEEESTLQAILTKYVQTAEERMDIEEKIYAVRKQILEKQKEDEEAHAAALLKDAYRVLDHQKSINALSLQDEEKTLMAIRDNFVSTYEERMDVEERLYDVRARIAEHETALLEKQKDKETDLLNQANAKYRADLEDRLAREELTSEQQFQVRRQMYDKIVQVNEDYLKRVLADESYTAEEKASIQAQITETIRQNINERLNLERDYYDQVRQQEIDSVNKLSKGVQAALREKYQAEKELGEENLKAQMDQNEAWRKNTIDTIKQVYDARVKAAEDAADREIAALQSTINARIKAIDDELEAMDKAETAKTRADLDAEDNLKAERLRNKITYEHDEFNKAQLQKELNKLLADQEKRHQDEQLEDKKDALKSEADTLKEQLSEQTQLIKDQLAEKKELLVADRDAEIERINYLAENQKLYLDNMLLAHQEHYNQLLTAKSLQAEAEKMIVQNQQTEIIALLKEFGDEYEITGQTLGQKMYEGFRDRFMQIQDLIDSVNAQIDAARDAAIGVMDQLSAARSAAGSSSVNTDNSRTVTVENNFYSPVTSPSDVSRATERVSRLLA